MIGVIVQHVEAVLHLIRIVNHKCAKKAVPNGKNIPKIRVCPWPLEMVLKLVHIWRNEKKTKRIIYPGRGSDICVGGVGEKDGDDPVKKVIRDGCPNNNSREK